jgi:hypothetical protein
MNINLPTSFTITAGLCALLVTALYALKWAALVGRLRDAEAFHAVPVAASTPLPPEPTAADYSREGHNVPVRLRNQPATAAPSAVVAPTPRPADEWPGLTHRQAFLAVVAEAEHGTNQAIKLRLAAGGRIVHKSQVSRFIREGITSRTITRDTVTDCFRPVQQGEVVVLREDEVES